MGAGKAHIRSCLCGLPYGLDKLAPLLTRISDLNAIKGFKIAHSHQPELSRREQVRWQRFTGSLLEGLDLQTEKKQISN